MKKFVNPLDPEDINIRAAIQHWTKDILKSDDIKKIEITEYPCKEASCLHTQTIIKVVHVLGTYCFCIAKPLTYIRKLDIQNMKEIDCFAPEHTH